MTRGDSTGRWVFQSQPRPEARGDEAATQRVRLGAALRAGHGVGASFAMAMSSGPEPTLELHTHDPSSGRWAGRVFATAYDRHQWRSIASGEGSTGLRSTWRADRVRPWPEPLWTRNEGLAMIDACLVAAASLPPGPRCAWWFRPLRLAHRHWWEVDSPAPAPIPPRRERDLSSRRPLPDPPQDRSGRPLFWELRVELVAELDGRRDRLGRSLARALESATRTDRGNGLRFRQRRWWVAPSGGWFPVSAEELVQILPTASSPAFALRGPLDGPRRDMLPLGRTLAGSAVGPTIEPGQGRHLAVLGETGMGKSSLLLALGRRVVEDSGLILFDPLGDTALAMRDELSSSLRDRMTWIEPGAPVGINALEGIGGGDDQGEARRERQLNDLVHSLRRVRSGRYADAGFWGPRLEEMLTRALRAAASFPGGTLVDAHSLLASGARGFRAIPAEATEVVRELADRIRSRPEDADGARRLLYEVTQSPILVRMLCERQPTLRAQDLVAPGRVVLIAGQAATVGESTARYLLSVYLALAWSALLSRPDGGKTFVVLDEAQWFVHESLAEMLRLGRRRNVHVVLATQAIASLPEPVGEAVWTNVADFVSFRGSPTEAREFARTARGISPEAILSLPRGEAVVLLGKGNSVHWLRTSRVPARRPGNSGDLVRDGGSKHGLSPDTRATQNDEYVTQAFGVADGSPSSQDVLRAVIRRVRQSDGDPLVRISLAELRAEVDPTGKAVRATGGILSQSGAIARTGRDEVGTCWWIDPKKIAPLEALAPPEVDRPASEPPQPS